ncbi:MAG: ankyrin repeat domain-containing protein [Ginsengibacter sp.]
MEDFNEIVGEIELHSVEGIKKCFSKGVNPNSFYRNVPLIYELTSEYTRTPRFRDCVKAFADHGLIFNDDALLSVLLDDAGLLEIQIIKNPQLISKKYSLRCAYTPLYEATLLHICAEFNHRSCAELLVAHGADINARAGIDDYGFGGQTPVFHTVNQNGNQSSGMMDFLLSKSADLTTTIKGITWGKGYDWETFIPSINPISYAMMGLLPQMHRNESVISQVVSALLQRAYGITYIPHNIPCRYLAG